MTTDALVGSFDQLVARRPQHPVVLSATGCVSVAELDAMARAFTERAFADRPAPGVVGLAVANGVAFLAAVVALRRLGHTVLLLDPQTPPDTLVETVSRFGGRRLVRLSAGNELRCVDCPAPQCAPWLGGVIKLSSGTTGEPRGVATPIAALMADDQALTRTMGIREQDRFLAMVPFSHSYGLSSLAVPALARGSQLVIPQGGSPFSAITAAEQFEATILPTVPAFLKALVRLGDRLRLPGSLRLVISAGAPLSPDTAAEFESVFGLPVHVFYGASESGGITYDRTGSAAKRGTVGAPVEGVSIQLEEPDNADGVGRVVVRSAAVADCYLLTPSSDLAGGRFRTSDVGQWVDGEIRIRGRRGDVINVRGKKVHPREVQEVIAALDGVDEALVTGSQEDDGVIAIVARNSGPVTGADVVAWCRRKLAPFKVPRRVVIVEEIPRTTRGKVDRDAVQRLVSRHRAPTRPITAPKRPITAPKRPVS